MKSKIYIHTSLILLCTGFWLIAYIIIGNWFTDDAFIAFRYAQNLFNGIGLVFNKGQYVQGYTSFIWIILLICLRYCQISFQISAIIINAISYVLFSFIIFNFLEKLFPKKTKVFYLLSSGVILSAPNMLSWTVGGGLEGPLFTTLLTLSFYLLLFKERKYISAIFFAILTLTRPEGCLFFLLGLSFLFYYKNYSRKGLLIFFITYSIPIIFYISWTYFYYMDVLPNTFYAKASISARGVIEGMHYLYRYLMSSPFIFFLLVLSFLELKKRVKKIKFFWIIITVYTFYIIIVGGDFMFAFRFYLPIIPFLYFLIIDELEYLYKFIFNSEKFLTWIFAFLIIYNLFSIDYFSDYKYQIKNYKMIHGGKVLANYFNENFPLNYTIASSGIGALGFYSNMKILDVLGLTNKVVAKEGNVGIDEIYSHGKSNKQYIMGQKPEIIVFGVPPGKKYPARFAEKEIYKSPLFNKNYKYIETKLKCSTIVRYYLLNNCFSK